MGRMVMQEDSEDHIEESYNADDKKHVNRARKKAARQKMLRDEVIRSVMSVKEGREWISYILTFCDVFGHAHVSGRPHDTAFNCGMQNVGKMLWKDVQDVAPETFTLMLKEAKENADQKE